MRTILNNINARFKNSPAAPSRSRHSMPAIPLLSAVRLRRILTGFTLAFAVLAGSAFADGRRADMRGGLDAAFPQAAGTDEDRSPAPQQAQDEPDVGKRRRGSPDLVPAHAPKPGVDGSHPAFPPDRAVLALHPSRRAFAFAQHGHPVLVPRLRACRGRAPPPRA